MPTKKGVTIRVEVDSLFKVFIIANETEQIRELSSGLAQKGFEDSTHTFIETVRNIGYRFRKEA